MICATHPRYRGVGKPKNKPNPACGVCVLIWKERQLELEAAAKKLPRTGK